MKYILNILLVMIFVSCSNSFLEIYPETSLNENIYYKSEKEYVLLANGCYVPMRNYYKEIFWVVSELPSDNGSFQYNSSDGGQVDRFAIELFQVSANNSIYGEFWNTSYNGIARCNKLISALSESTISWDTEGLKERCFGEGYFLRALYYFNLVRVFGGVPLVMKPITSQEAVSIKRSSEDVIYEQILSDLKQAISYFEQTKNVNENGRANYIASQTLLGKVFLTLHKYQEAEMALKDVVDSKKHTLLSDYADLFEPSKKDFIETIFAIQYSENSVELSNQFRFYFAPWTSKGEITQRPNISINGTRYGWNQPTVDLINAFEVGDLRKSVSIGFWQGLDWDGIKRPVPFCNKFKPPVTAPDNRCSDNFPVLRYSDVLLMLAESLNEQNRTTDALPYVEQVRNRAGLKMPDNLTKESLSDLIAKERTIEFCFENQRWFDLKRTNKAIDVISAHGKREKETKNFLQSNTYLIKEYMLLAPIPPEQIIANGLEQNPGY